MAGLDLALQLSALQLSSFEGAKDYIIMGLAGLVGSLLGLAWGDLRWKIRALETKLEAKIKEDTIGYERLTRCEERLDAIRGRRHDDGA